jgi:hypothetical protein
VPASFLVVRDLLELFAYGSSGLSAIAIEQAYDIPLYKNSAEVSTNTARL